MAKRSLLIWILLVMPLMFLPVYGCNTVDTLTTSSPTPSTASTSPDITTTPPHDNELYFDELWTTLRHRLVEDINPYIVVITHTQSTLPDRWEYFTSDRYREKFINIEDVDFSKYFILVMSMGFQGVTGPKITVESIWQVGDTIYTQADFDLGGPTYQPLYSEPARSVMVSKENMTQFGEITFILLDQEWEERARITCEIPADTRGNIDTITPPENILTFEDIAINWLYKELDIPTQIRVMTSIDSQLPNVIDYITPESQPELNTVDFSRYLLIFAFMGFQSVTGPTIEVTQIWQIDNTIYVEAFFDQGGPTYQPTHSSPADVVRLSKENISHFGVITFILIDQDGTERARTTCEIPE